MNIFVVKVSAWTLMAALSLASVGNTSPVPLKHPQPFGKNYNITIRSPQAVHCDSPNVVHFSACGFSREELERAKCCMVVANSSGAIKELPTSIPGYDSGCLHSDNKLEVDKRVEIFCSFECTAQTRIGSPFITYDGYGPCKDLNKFGSTQRIGVALKSSASFFLGILSIENRGTDNYNRAAPMRIMVTVTCDSRIKRCVDVQFCAAPVLKSYHVGIPFILTSSSSPDEDSVSLDRPSWDPQFAHYDQFTLWPVDKHVHPSCSYASLQMAVDRKLNVSLSFSRDELPLSSPIEKSREVIIQQSTPQIPDRNPTEPRDSETTTLTPLAIAGIVGAVMLSFLISVVIYCWCMKKKTYRAVFCGSTSSTASVTKIPPEDSEIRCSLLTKPASVAPETELPESRSSTVQFATEAQS